MSLIHIIHTLSAAAASDESVVLATVVRVTGSSYGGAGARMVAKLDGSTVGIVSGGCLEGDLAEHAREVLQSGRAKLVTYDTTGDEDAPWGLGLGCNGVIDVLLEPLDPVGSRAVTMLLDRALAGPGPCVLATVVRSPDGEGAPAVGAHALLSDREIESTGNWGNLAALHVAQAHVDEAMAEGRRGLIRDLAGAAIAFERIQPAFRVVICGSGPDVQPVVRLANELGYYLTVVEHRPAESDHTERFPGADVIECAEPDDLAAALPLNDASAAIVMSHHYGRDKGYLRALLASDARFIGMLGPRARTERMLAELEQEGAAIRAPHRVFAPLGLDLGGEGPGAIALSILAELSAVMHDRSGAHLRDSRGGLHGQPPSS